MAVERKRYVVKGFVQGVGFRPFVYTLAKKLKITGSVCNSSEGVIIEAQGEEDALGSFLGSLRKEKPKIAHVIDVEESPIDIISDECEFVIAASVIEETPNTFILPDLATCQACLDDVTTPGNRRYRYPFTSCTHCGPRFSIINTLPYDRHNTTMHTFPMCTQCQREYDDPLNRRFHAQPNACPECGPHCELWDQEGHVLAKEDDALCQGVQQIKHGAIVAVKGIGGFHLVVDASNDDAIERLRMRKHRPDKPFAVMYPDIEAIRRDCAVSKEEEALLTSPEAPIVLLKAKVFPSKLIAPGNPYIGVMLPYSPLHHILLNDMDTPLIATSGNRSDEPLCINEQEALEDLKGIADVFLIHNRPIAHPIDDSIVQVVSGKRQILRRARGYASRTITIEKKLPHCFAVGGHMKGCVAAAKGRNIFLSQHLGNLDNLKASSNFEMTIDQLLGMYAINPEVVISDLHPDYTSTRYASSLELPIKQCQHHVAHVYACMAENHVDIPCLGVAWDGTGYGLDGTIWGGEFFLIGKDGDSKRVATIHPFPLPCGEKAIKEPRLSAIGVLYEIYGDPLFEMEHLSPIRMLSETEKSNLKKILEKQLLSPRCSSMGRLFDAVASLIGLHHKVSFEGQAAMALQYCAEESRTEQSYPFSVDTDDFIKIDWRPIVEGIIEDLSHSPSKTDIAAKFHNTLAQVILSVANLTKQKTVLLSGGVFQNKMLTEKAVTLLKNNGFTVYHPSEIPPNDGGIALGQIFSQLKNQQRVHSS